MRVSTHRRGLGAREARASKDDLALPRGPWDPLILIRTPFCSCPTRGRLESIGKCFPRGETDAILHPPTQTPDGELETRFGPTRSRAGPAAEARTEPGRRIRGKMPSTWTLAAAGRCVKRNRLHTLPGEGRASTEAQYEGDVHKSMANRGASVVVSLSFWYDSPRALLRLPQEHACRCTFIRTSTRPA